MRPRRFERITHDVEPVEEYRRGGYHPVHLGDMFKNGRYKVLGKLAYGMFSTVWLANDRRLRRNVALKIVKADSSKDNEELAILLHLANQGSSHPGRKHILQLLDHFKHDGPNGTHLCLVFPVMLSDGELIADAARRKQPEACYVREVSRQILLGLDYIHGRGVIHYLQPANIMISVDGGSIRAVDVLQRELEKSFVVWLEGVEVDDSAPEYLVTPQRADGALDDGDPSKLSIRIGDFGGATRHVNPDHRPVTAAALRAPELICGRHWDGRPWDKSIDIWALGCLVFQIATEQMLFPLELFCATVEDIDKQHKALIQEIIGADDGTHERFAAFTKEKAPSDWSDDDVLGMARFLRGMLQKDPRGRKSTKELLEDPWLIGSAAKISKKKDSMKTELEEKGRGKQAAENRRGAEHLKEGASGQHRRQRKCKRSQDAYTKSSS